MTPKEERRLKNEFIKKNPYARRGLKGATGHVRFYTEEGARRKVEIQNSWTVSMEAMAEHYCLPQSRETFVNDVRELMNNMNNLYRNAFYGGQFSFARAQKSFSLFLKYRWCSGQIPAPPLCPIDRGVLNHIGHPYDRWKWTGMTEQQYMLVYDRLDEIARDNNETVAQLELRWFG